MIAQLYWFQDEGNYRDCLNALNCHLEVIADCVGSDDPLNETTISFIGRAYARMIPGCPPGKEREVFGKLGQSIGRLEALLPDSTQKEDILAAVAECRQHVDALPRYR